MKDTEEIENNLTNILFLLLIRCTAGKKRVQNKLNLLNRLTSHSITIRNTQFLLKNSIKNRFKHFMQNKTLTACWNGNIFTKEFLYFPFIPRYCWINSIMFHNSLENWLFYSFLNPCNCCFYVVVSWGFGTFERIGRR